MIDQKVLIIGKIPPPIGGVTVHVKRLIQTLPKQDFHHFHFLDLSKNSIQSIFTQILTFPVIHLHTSQAYFQLFTALLCRLTKRTLIITYHGHLGRYRAFKNAVVRLSCTLCKVPIVQNEASLRKAISWNPRARFISAFIREQDPGCLPPAMIQRFLISRKKYKAIFCTNACHLSFDKDGREIYGISALIEKFTLLPQAQLILAGVSLSYVHYLQKNVEIPSNVWMIPLSYQLPILLEYCDAFIRNTTTDGDSISIHEALESGKTVFATNAVPRPARCNLYDHISEVNLLETVLLEKKYRKKYAVKNENIEEVTESLAKLYYKYISEVQYKYETL